MTTRIDTNSTSTIILSDGLLRRQLFAEMAEVGEEIARSGFRDEMTQEISLWQQRFVTALRSSADEHRVCSDYIRLLQELLCDPVTNAPLDTHALLGSDGHTYGQMSLAVYVLSVPEEYRTRSPLDIQNPDHFYVTPHRVARFMTGWLQRHDALLYSEELERTYLHLQPQNRPMDTQTRMENLIRRRAELDQRERQQRRERTRVFDRRQEERLQARSREVAQLTADLASLRGRSRATMDGMTQEAEEHLHATAEPVRDHLHQAEEQHQRDFSRLHTNLEEMEDPLAPIREEVDATDEEERASLARLRERVEEYMRTSFEPLAQELREHASETERKIHEVEEKDRQSLNKIDERIQQMQGDIENLKKQNEEIGKSQQDVSVKLNEMKIEQISLEKSIVETEKAIEEMKKRLRNQLLMTIGIVVGCCFATLAMGWMLAGTCMSASAVPAEGGAVFQFTVAL